MLRVRQRLPFRQICAVFRKMAGLTVSAGALVEAAQAHRPLAGGRVRELVLRMRASKVLHADETGWRIEGRNAWTWVFTQPLLTLFVTDESRGARWSATSWARRSAGSGSATSTARTTAWSATSSVA